MLKVYDSAVTFSEFPDEITLCVNISNCPGYCDGCSEPWLLKDIGEELTNEKIDALINEHKDITVFGLMGGDNDHNDVVRVVNYIHTKYPQLKVGMYSGRDYMSMKLLEVLDLYKIGRFIMPKGPVEEWHKTNNGVLQFPWSNQLLFEKQVNPLTKDVVWLNTTYKFRKAPLGNPERYIIKDSKEED